MKKRVSRALAGMLALVLAFGTATCALAEGLDKKETVYVLSDAAGAVQQIIVSEKLTNREGADVLHDVSRLRDIENLSGEQTFSEEDGLLIWQADGEAITYQGLSDEELPVSLSLRYELDGEPVAPEELAGRSGQLVMEVEYASRLTGWANVNGEATQLPVPFLMATVLLIDGDAFENVEIDHGRLLEVGDRKLIVTWGLPGLREALNLSGEEEDGLDVPSGARIRADVEGFSLGGSYTVASGAVLGALNSADQSGEIDLDALTGELSEAMDQLLDGSLQLLEGSRELSDGLSELDSHSESLNDGARQVLNAVLDTANQTLEDRRETFEQYGIALNALTMDNYADEIARIQKQLLETAEAEVLRQAEEELTEKVTEAVREEVSQQVREAVRAEVAAQVVEAAREQVRQAVEETVSREVRKKVQGAVQSQVEGKVNSTVRQQVTGQVDAALDGQIHQQVVEAVRSAVTEQVNAQRETIRAGVTESYRAAIQAQVTASITDDMRKTMTEEQLAAYVAQAVEQGLAARQEELDAKVEETVLDTIEQNMNSDAVRRQIAAAEQEQLKNREALLASAVEAQMETDAVRNLISQMVEEQMNSAAIRQTIEKNTEAQMATDAVRATVEENTEAQMASDSVRKTIESNEKAQMASAQVREILEANLAEQMNGEQVRQIIAQNIEEQRASDAYQKALEEARRENGVQSESYQSLVTLKETLDSMKRFYEGVVSYTGAVGEAAGGAMKLSEGAAQLHDGLQRFSEEAIDRILGLLGDDLKPMLARAQAVSGLAEAYQSYAGKADDMTGSVQFVIRTPSIG